MVNSIPDIHVSQVNCANIIGGDQNELQSAGTYQKGHPKQPVLDRDLEAMASNCDTFKQNRGYMNTPVNQEESTFPIAFSILLFKDTEQFERLLRAIYRPQNFYCVHVDQKSAQSIKNATKAIVKCFDNVFIASKETDVRWGSYTVLEPEITCMGDLLRFKRWKYFINLTGQEFPLKTNLDLVRILRVYNGANNLEGTIKR